MSEDATILAVVQPEFPEVLEACPPGTNPPAGTPAKANLAKAKRAKATAKLYYVTDGFNGGDVVDRASFRIVDGSEGGFRTKEELAKFVKTLTPGTYTPISVPTKTITVAETKRISVKGI